MGWAIQRSDGTYRAWDDGAKPPNIQLGEVYVELVACPLLTELPTADWPGFLKWMDATFDGPTLTTWANAYGAFFGWAQFGNAPRVQWVITDAKTKGTITTAQYALFQGANTTYHLGMVLP